MTIKTRYHIDYYYYSQHIYIYKHTHVPRMFLSSNTRPRICIDLTGEARFLSRSETRSSHESSPQTDSKSKSWTAGWNAECLDMLRLLLSTDSAADSALCSSNRRLKTWKNCSAPYEDDGLGKQYYLHCPSLHELCRLNPSASRIRGVWAVSGMPFVSNVGAAGAPSSGSSWAFFSPTIYVVLQSENLYCQAPWNHLGSGKTSVRSTCMMTSGSVKRDVQKCLEVTCCDICAS